MRTRSLTTFPDEGKFRTKTTINQTLYQLEFKYRSRTRTWYLDILTEDGQAVVRGVALVPGSLPLQKSNIQPENFIFFVAADPVDRDEIPTIHVFDRFG